MHLEICGTLGCLMELVSARLSPHTSFFMNGNNMENLIRRIGSGWDSEPGATNEEIEAAQDDLQIQIPEDYRRFLMWSNGGEGQVGNLYLSPWPTHQLKAMNEGYLISQYLPGIIGIGSNLGTLCFAFDYRFNKTHPSFVSVPFGDCDFTSVTVLGESFQKALEQALNSGR